LACALERIQDSEEGALALLDENNSIFQKAKLAEANIILLRQEVSKARRGSAISFAFGSVGFGVGVPLITQGIMTDNSTMTWTGVGTVAVTGGFWAIGHFVFKWW